MDSFSPSSHLFQGAGRRRDGGGVEDRVGFILYWIPFLLLLFRFVFLVFKINMGEGFYLFFLPFVCFEQEIIYCEFVFECFHPAAHRTSFLFPRVTPPSLIDSIMTFICCDFWTRVRQTVIFTILLCSSSFCSPLNAWQFLSSSE